MDDRSLRYAERCCQTGKKVFDSAKIWKTEISDKDPRVISALLLARTLNNLRGVIVLLQSEMLVESRILARCCLENLFTVVMLQEKGQYFVDQMEADRDADRKARGEFLLKHGDTSANLRAYLRSLPKTRARQLNPKKVAIGPLERGYAYYAALSADAGHPGLDALQHYLFKTGNTLQVNVEPECEDAAVRQTINWACEAMIGITIHVNTILDGPNDPELIALIDEMGNRARTETVVK